MARQTGGLAKPPSFPLKHFFPFDCFLMGILQRKLKLPGCLVPGLRLFGQQFSWLDVTPVSVQPEVQILSKSIM